MNTYKKNIVKVQKALGNAVLELSQEVLQKRVSVTWAGKEFLHHALWEKTSEKKGTWMWIYLLGMKTLSLLQLSFERGITSWHELSYKLPYEGPRQITMQTFSIVVFDT